MLDIFSPIPVRAQDVTANLINTQIKIHQKDMFSGVFHISGEAQSAFLFISGKLISVYKLVNRNWRRFPKVEWDDVIADASGNLRVATMSGEGLRILRLFLESDFSESKTIPSLPASELAAYVKNAPAGNYTRLISLRQNGASALLLFPPGETTPAEALLVDEDQTQTGVMVSNQVRAWGDQACQVLLCGHDPNSEAWREYALRVSFAQFTQLVLKRYGEIAGKFLVTDLNEQINDEAKNWNIALSLYGDKLSNRQFFEDTQRAGEAYVTIYTAIREQMKSVVGDKVVVDIRKEAIIELNLDTRILVQEYVISRLQ